MSIPSNLPKQNPNLPNQDFTPRKRSDAKSILGKRMVGQSILNAPKKSINFSSNITASKESALSESQKTKDLVKPTLQTEEVQPSSLGIKPTLDESKAQAEYQMGESFLKQNNIEEALKHYETASNMGGQTALKAHKQYDDLMIFYENYKKASKQVDSEQNKIKMYNLAKSYEREKSYDLALIAYASYYNCKIEIAAYKVAEKHVKDAKAAYNEKRSDDQDISEELLIEYYDRAIASGNKDAAFFAGSYLEAYSSEKKDKILYYFSKAGEPGKAALNAIKGDRKAALNVGKCLEKANRLNEAVRFYQKALDLDEAKKAVQELQNKLISD